MFGISSALELYQHIIQQVLQGCEGAHNIADDIIVHGRRVEEHDKRMDRVFHRLQQRGLTVNPDKCEFRIPRITFMGYVLSEKGIGPMEEKVKAVSEAREPECAFEVRSFLGLVNFCAQFIPDLATTADPLRKLKRKVKRFSGDLNKSKPSNSLRRSYQRLRHSLTLTRRRRPKSLQMLAL